MGWGGMELGSGKRGVVGEGVLGLDCVKGEFGDFCFRDSNLLRGIGFCNEGSFNLGIWVGFGFCYKAGVSGWLLVS